MADSVELTPHNISQKGTYTQSHMGAGFSPGGGIKFQNLGGGGG